MQTELPTYLPNIPYERRRFWNDFQKTNYLDGCTLIEFMTDTEEYPYWRVYIDFKNYKTLITNTMAKGLSPIDTKENQFKGNHELHYLFDTSYVVSNNSWNTYRKAIDLKGFFIPQSDVGELPKSQLSIAVNFLRLKSKHFPFVDWLRLVKEETLRNEYAQVTIPVISSWYFFRYYITFVKKVSSESPVIFQRIRSFLFKETLATDIEKQLPSAQLLYLLTGICESFYLNKKQDAFLTRFLAKAHPIVVNHWTELKTSYLHYIQQGFGNLTLPKDVLPPQQIKDQFYHFFNKDLPLLNIQSVLDADVTSDFWQQLPVDFQYQYGSNRNVSLANRMKNFIGNVSIMDRIQSFSKKTTVLPLPKLSPLSLSWMKKDTVKWFELTIEEQAHFTQMIEEFYEPITFTNLKKVAKVAQQTYYKNLLNQYTAPFFQWTATEKGILPQWNVLSISDSEKIVDQFLQKRRAEAEAEDELRRQLIELSAIKNIHKLQQFHANGGKEFEFSHLQEQWIAALTAHRIKLENTRSYRIRRMKEFGLLEEEEKPTATTESLLDEMLQVEKEITPYISFVKNAFKSALPMRKTTAFNPYRHSHDGIEFDPTTIQDQNKWMNGEVMKTLEVKVTKGDAIQINAFALDASGSMDHIRMRNLFKILYLLILGLEDRKTYDAIHFFSTDFMEAAHFTDNYTDRKLLYKILKSISYVSNTKGVVYGGFGGTNISAGLRECHKQVTALSEKLQQQKPDMLHLKSIFIITDGRPSMGITNHEQLGEFIQEKRKTGKVAIKGIYLKPPPKGVNSDPQLYKHPGETGWGFMETIFGKDNYVETDDFGEAVRKFVYIMTLTFRRQRMEE